MRETPDLLEALRDEYEIGERLGQGGSAVVYRARDRELERDVAIKLIDDGHLLDGETRARFRREARTLAMLQHPSIVQVYRAVRLPDDRLALVMQYLAGPTLRELLRERGALPVATAAAIARDIAGALAFLHRRGIVHRDVKPENIYVDPESGRALLSDFGIAKAADARSEVTMMGAVIGTPTYMAPEQIDGRTLDGRSDLYALGLVAHEMLSGCRPWAGENLYAIIYKQKHEELPPLASLRADVPPGLSRAVERALRKDPEERWPTGEELAAALAGEVDEEPRLSPAEPAGASAASGAAGPLRWDEVEELIREPRTPRRGVPRRAAALLIVGLGAAATAGALSWDREPDPIPLSAVVSAAPATGSAPPSAAASVADPGATNGALLPHAGALLPPALAPAAAGPASTAVPPAAAGDQFGVLRQQIEELQRQLALRPATAPAPSAPPPPAEAPAEAPPPAAELPGASAGAEPPVLLPRIAAPVPVAQPRIATPPPVRREAASPAGEAPEQPPRLVDHGALVQRLNQSWTAGKGRATLQVRLQIDSSGRVVHGQVHAGSGSPGLDREALSALRAARFAPAQRNGRPVGAVILFPIALNP